MHGWGALYAPPPPRGFLPFTKKIFRQPTPEIFFLFQLFVADAAIKKIQNIKFYILSEYFWDTKYKQCTCSKKSHGVLSIKIRWKGCVEFIFENIFRKYSKMKILVLIFSKEKSFDTTFDIGVEGGRCTLMMRKTDQTREMWEVIIYYCISSLIYPYNFVRKKIILRLDLCIFYLKPTCNMVVQHKMRPCA